jgi:hypothetical protein
LGGRENENDEGSGGSENEKLGLGGGDTLGLGGSEKLADGAGLGISKDDSHGLYLVNTYEEVPERRRLKERERRRQ